MYLGLEHCWYCIDCLWSIGTWTTLLPWCYWKASYVSGENEVFLFLFCTIWDCWWSSCSLEFSIFSQYYCFSSDPSSDSSSRMTTNGSVFHWVFWFYSSFPAKSVDFEDISSQTDFLIVHPHLKKLFLLYIVVSAFLVIWT